MTELKRPVNNIFTIQRLPATKNHCCVTWRLVSNSNIYTIYPKVFLCVVALGVVVSKWLNQRKSEEQKRENRLELEKERKRCYIDGKNEIKLWITRDGMVSPDTLRSYVDYIVFLEKRKKYEYDQKSYKKDEEYYAEKYGKYHK